MPLSPDAAFALMAGLVGLLVGSFLNVVIHRLPKMMHAQWAAQAAEFEGRTLAPQAPYNLWRPPSQCPACGARVAALQNIPVISYLALRGRCAHCATRISPRYPIVEALTGVLSFWVATHFGWGLAGAGALVLTWYLVALSFIDADTTLLPDSMTLPLLWLGLLLNLDATFAPLRDAVMGACAGYLSLWLVYWAFKLTTGREGMGYGDFKLLAAFGAWLGWKMLLPIVLLSSLAGAIVGIGLILLARRGRQIPIPFGPYLALAGFLALLYGPPIVERLGLG
ncbi:Type 4 prepilin-like proteins leader peptide-processing enzyme (Includes: Leader peptidase; N-methyltransferase) [Burkholderiales bacterium]|nr:Type 4 prepilin-like proteins leader peptide-processing enzyme (Includes: Leader peptidase; N-methyltransferase) [Burkholderiales bacterium]